MLKKIVHLFLLLVVDLDLTLEVQDAVPVFLRGGIKRIGLRFQSGICDIVSIMIRT